MATKAKAPVKPAPRKAAVKPAPKAPARKAAPKKPAPFHNMVEGTGRELVEVDDTMIPQSKMAVYSDQPDMNPEDLFVPRLRLAQGLTAEVQNGEAKPGQWIVLGSEPMAEVTIIPVAMTRRRELRSSEDRTAVCRSGDGLTGICNPGGECATCPAAAWTENKRSKTNNPPLCTFMYSYMVWVQEAESMAILEFSRTSITTAKMINTMIAQQGLSQFAIKLGSASKQSSRGNYYTPTVSFEKAKTEVLKRAVAESQTIR